MAFYRFVGIKSKLCRHRYISVFQIQTYWLPGICSFCMNTYLHYILLTYVHIHILYKLKDINIIIVNYFMVYCLIKTACWVKQCSIFWIKSMKCVLIIIHNYFLSFFPFIFLLWCQFSSICCSIVHHIKAFLPSSYFLFCLFITS